MSKYRRENRRIDPGSVFCSFCLGLLSLVVVLSGLALLSTSHSSDLSNLPDQHNSYTQQMEAMEDVFEKEAFRVLNIEIERDSLAYN